MLAFAVGVALIAISAFTLLRHQRAVRAASIRIFVAPPTSAITPLISLPGEQGMPAFSPDGSRVAFHWTSPDAKSSGIYAVVVGSQSLLRLTHDGHDVCPVWSPDGRFLAFLRNSDETFSIYVVPALGGAERRLYSGTRIPWVGPEGISFSPDGTVIAFADWSAEARTSSIKALSLNDSSVRTLTQPPPGYHDAAPAFSPDGRRVAFVRTTGPIFLDELYVTNVSGGEPKELTSDHHRIFGSLLWTKDGSEIVFASNRAGLKSLWRISGNGGVPRPVLGPGPVADHPSISPSTGLLAYEYSVEDENLWRVDLSRSGAGGNASPLFSAKSSNLMPQFSPDGQKIAFEGDRSGYEEIWICDPDGSNPVQVTRLESFSGSPRWSPDNRMLAFDSRKEEHSGIYVIDLSNGSVRAVPTFPDANNVVPSWSHDGQWIYFASDHSSKSFQIWKAPLGGGPPVLVTRNPGFAAFESDDQKYVYYARLSEPGIWRVPKMGGTEARVWSGPGPDNWANWALAKDAIYLTISERGRRSVIQRLDIAGRHLTPVSTLERPAFYGLTVSASSIVYSQRDRDEHDVVITRLFQ
jgi:Tol biopolymer transport system component